MKTQKLRAAIVGCGNIFPMHAVPIANSKFARLVAVCDNKHLRAQDAAGRFGGKAYTDFDKMLETEQPDTVHICTPHYLHAPFALKALKYGCHVITEKPMSIHQKDALAMLDAAKKADKTLAVIFQNRYNHGAQLIKQCLDSDELGDVVSARMILTWDRSEEYYSKSDWKGTIEQEGGGVVIDQAIHTLDMMRWLVGYPVVSVQAQVGNLCHPSIQVEDTSQGKICFENGITGSFYAMNYHSCDAPVILELQCSKGFARMEGPASKVMLNNGKTLAAEINPEEFFEYGNIKQCWGTSHIKQINNFYSYLCGCENLYISAEDAFETQRLVCAIYESGRQNKKVIL